MYEGQATQDYLVVHVGICLDQDFDTVTHHVRHDAPGLEGLLSVVHQVRRPVDGVFADLEPGVWVVCCTVVKSSVLLHGADLLTHVVKHCEVTLLDCFHQRLAGARCPENPRVILLRDLQFHRLVEGVGGVVALYADQFALVDDVVDWAPPRVEVAAADPVGVAGIRPDAQVVGMFLAL